MTKRIFLAVSIAAIVLVVGFRDMVGLHARSPAPAAGEPRPDQMRGGSTPVEVAASPASRPPRSRRPADPDRGADPSNAPILKLVKETPRYRVSSDMSQKVCDDGADLLERAWPIWCRRFGLDEAYDPGPGRFSVRIYETDSALFNAILKETGQRISCLGFVGFLGFRMFVCHHQDEYESRRILLHEGAHQFLYRLVGSAAAERLPRWYDEGCAHESEKHRLDGEDLQLFQHTGGAFSNQIDQALRCFKPGPWTVRYFLAGDAADETRSRACGWAIVHFMRSGADPVCTKWFQEYEAALHSGSREQRRALHAEIGDAYLTKQLVAYLEKIAAEPESRAK